MINFPDGEMVGIFGPVSSGKTHLIKKWLQTQNRFVAFDYSGELMYLESYYNYPKYVYNRVKQNPYFFKLAYIPGVNVEDDFKWILWALWFAPVKKLLVCDEVHRIMPNVVRQRPEVETLLRFARHANLSFIGASQRIQDVSKLFTSACRTNILFQTNESTSLDAIQDRWNCAEMVRNLRPLIYDDYNRIVKQKPQVVICQKGKEPYIEDA